MSIHFVITPYDPESLTKTSSLKIDPIEFQQNLAEIWQLVEFETTVMGSLLWVIDDGSDIGFRGSLQSNLQIVTFSPGNWITYKEFILWYRTQVPEEYTLYFFNTSSTNSLIVSSRTKIQDIENFVAGNH